MKELTKQEINKLGFLVFNTLLQKEESLKVFTASLNKEENKIHRMFVDDLQKEIEILKSIQKKLGS